ncbi:MAG: hypothetical protein V4697_03100 [Patescibacteria group bacterium]
MTTIFINSYRFSAPFDPDDEQSLVFRIVADDNVGADGSDVGPWTTRIGALTDNSPWSFSSKPVLKTSIINGHKIVRFGGFPNMMRADQPVVGADVLVFVVGKITGIAANSPVLTIHKEDAEDSDSSEEGLFYQEGHADGGTFISTYANNARRAQGLHPKVGVPFIFCGKFDGSENTNFLVDYPSLSVACTNSFNGTRIGLASQHTGGGYSNWSQIDLAEVMVLESSDDALREDVVEYLSTQYAIPLPRVLITLGDSITAAGAWVENNFLPLYTAGDMYIDNLAVGGHNLDQVAADALAADIYTRISSRANPAKTVVFVWEYVNAKNAGNTDQQIVDKTAAICALVRAAGAKALVATDFHDATSSVNCQGASTLMAAQWSTFADGIVDLNLQSLRNDSNNNSDTTHLTSVGNAIVAPLVKSAVDAIIA